MSVEQQQMEAVERRLTRALGWWSLASVAAGAAVAATGRRGRPPWALQFGRQTAAWGAVDGVIAAAAVASRRRRDRWGAEEVVSRARRLRLILMANAVADVGYVLAGVVITARARRGRATWRLGAGDGAAIVVQGGFLLVLDTVTAWRLQPTQASDTATRREAAT